MKPSLWEVLVELDRTNAHILYDTHTKQASLCDGDLAATGSRENIAVSQEDLLALFEKAWITRVGALNGLYRYRITDLGRRATRE
jgi:hypothetical protein